MRTLGVDLSTIRGQTALCVLDGRVVEEVRCTRGSAVEVVGAMAEADRTGIDAPFGWPDAFRKAIDAWSDRGVWTAGEQRRDLRLRLTDQHLADEYGLSPMSVSADRIGSTAMHCADILHRHAGPALDRVHGDAIEVYPAGALRQWGLPAKGYKGKDGGKRRREIMSALVERGGLKLSAATKERCLGNDHMLDALICALVAMGPTEQIVGNADQIAREGWIHLPTPDSLGHLRDGS